MPSAKPHDDTARILAILRRLVRDADSMTPVQKRTFMARIDVWLDEFNRVKSRD